MSRPPARTKATPAPSFAFSSSLREEQSLTYLMITHDMRAVATYATRLIVLRDGHVALQVHQVQFLPSGKNWRPAALFRRQLPIFMRSSLMTRRRGWRSMLLTLYG